MFMPKIHYVEDGDLPNEILYTTGKYCLGYVVWAHGWVDVAFFHDGNFWNNGEKIYPVAWCELKPPKRVIKKWGDRSMKTFYKEHKSYYKELLKKSKEKQIEERKTRRNIQR